MCVWFEHDVGDYVANVLMSHWLFLFVSDSLGIKSADCIFIIYLFISPLPPCCCYTLSVCLLDLVCYAVVVVCLEMVDASSVSVTSSLFIACCVLCSFQSQDFTAQLILQQRVVSSTLVFAYNVNS